jgi:hypothetical protein
MSHGAAALTASLPRALGREPRNELVLVGVSSVHTTAATLWVLGLEDTDTEEGAEEVAASIHHMVSGLVHDGATKVAVVVYAEDTTADSTAARLAATAVVCSEAAGLGVLDAIAVTRGRWRSYECTNPSCCPPEGTPILEGPTP